MHLVIVSRSSSMTREVSLAVTNSTKAWATALEMIKNEFSQLRYAHRHLQVPTIISGSHITIKLVPAMHLYPLPPP
eukprot:1186777-Prymnesium_polylepis.2